MPLPAVAVIAPVLSYIAVSLVTRVLLAVGFGVVTYIGIGELFADAEAFVFSNFGNTSNSILQILAMARVDDFMRLLFSAYLATLSLKGLTAAGGIAVGRWLTNSSGG
jgi:hypothetical protein